MTVTKQKHAHLWEQNDRHWYVEPERCTAQLLEVERFNGAIHDPACGRGNIVRTLIEAGYTAVGTDIERRVPEGTDWFLGEVDFLAGDMPPFHYPNIVMNPPFFRAKGAEGFIRKALSIAEGKVAAFLDMRFIAGEGRARGLFADHPPYRIWMVTPRPSCPPGEYLLAGGEPMGGTADYCWMVWDRTAPFYGTMTGWLRK